MHARLTQRTQSKLEAAGYLSINQVKEASRDDIALKIGHSATFEVESVLSHLGLTFKNTKEESIMPTVLTAAEIHRLIFTGQEVGIGSVDFTERTQKALEAAGYFSINKLQELTSNDLREIDYNGFPFGNFAIAEVEVVLSRLGLKLKDTRDERLVKKIYTHREMFETRNGKAFDFTVKLYQAVVNEHHRPFDVFINDNAAGFSPDHPTREHLNVAVVIDFEDNVIRVYDESFIIATVTTQQDLNQVLESLRLVAALTPAKHYWGWLKSKA